MGVTAGGWQPPFRNGEIDGKHNSQAVVGPVEQCIAGMSDEILTAAQLLVCPTTMSRSPFRGCNEVACEKRGISPMDHVQPPRHSLPVRRAFPENQKSKSCWHRSAHTQRSVPNAEQQNPCAGQTCSLPRAAGMLVYPPTPSRPFTPGMARALKWRRGMQRTSDGNSGGHTCEPTLVCVARSARLPGTSRGPTTRRSSADASSALGQQRHLDSHSHGVTDTCAPVCLRRANHSSQN